MKKAAAKKVDGKTGRVVATKKPTFASMKVKVRELQQKLRDLRRDYDEACIQSGRYQTEALGKLLQHKEVVALSEVIDERNASDIAMKEKIAFWLKAHFGYAINGSTMFYGEPSDVYKELDHSQQACLRAFIELHEMLGYSSDSKSIREQSHRR